VMYLHRSLGPLRYRMVWQIVGYRAKFPLWRRWRFALLLPTETHFGALHLGRLRVDYGLG
jgi:hypothetical protein